MPDGRKLRTEETKHSFLSDTTEEAKYNSSFPPQVETSTNGLSPSADVHGSRMDTLGG